MQDEGIFALDSRGQLTYLNAVSERLCGWREQELLGKAFLGSVLAVDDELNAFSLADATLRDSADHVRIGNALLVRKDGAKTRIVHITVPVIEGDEVRGSLTVWRPSSPANGLDELLPFLRRAVGGAPQAILIAEPDCRVRYINETAGETFGYTAKSLNESGGLHALFADPHSAQMFFHALQCGAWWSARTEVVTGLGGVASVFTQVGPLRDAEGRVVAVVGVYGLPEPVKDLSAAQRAEQAIVLRTDAEGRAVFVNDVGRELLGLESSDGTPVFGSIVPGVLGLRETCGAPDVPLHSRIRASTGKDLQIAWSVTQLIDALGRMSGANCIGSVLPPEDTENNDELRYERERAFFMLDHVGDGVVAIDTLGNIEYLNPVAEQLIGCSAGGARGRPLLQVIDLTDEATGLPVDDPVRRSLQEGCSIHSNSCAVLRREDGRESLVRYRVDATQTRERGVTGAVLILNDVTEQLGIERQMAYQATHDALTGLLNRREFEARVTQALVDARTESRQFAVLVLDLDQFKVVNDTCGHNAGDVLLKQVTALFYGTLERFDGMTLARTGGDEFGVLLADCPLERAQQIAESLCAAIRGYRFSWLDKSFEIGVSIGVASISTLSGSLAEVLSAVEAACYLAKDKGRNRAHVYQPDDVALQQRRDEMRWVHRLHQALNENQFCLYYQQILPLSSRVSGEHHHEILLRLIEGNGDVVAPATFIAAAERYQLMPAVDRWVVGRAFPMIKALRADGVERWDVFTINLSGQSLCDEKFLGFVIDQARKTAVQASGICFEITETAAITNLPRASDFIATLKGMGFRFALDDFGSGLSSFGYLKNLPVDYLKIDGSFVRDVVHDSANQAMIESINHIGHVLGIQTIAEFVENDDILQKLWEMGIDHVQGYGIARPKPLWQSFQRGTWH